MKRVYLPAIKLLLIVMVGFLPIRSMDQNSCYNQDRIHVHDDVIRVILSFLPIYDQAFNTLMRHYGVTPDNADKIVKKLVKSTKIYPYNYKQISKLLANFKTAKPSVQLTKSIEQALLRYRNSNSLQTLMYNNCNKWAIPVFNEISVSYTTDDMYIDCIKAYPAIAPFITSLKDGISASYITSLSFDQLLHIKHVLELVLRELESCKKNIHHIAGSKWFDEGTSYPLLKNIEYLCIGLGMFSLWNIQGFINEHYPDKLLSVDLMQKLFYGSQMLMVCLYGSYRILEQKAFSNNAKKVNKSRITYVLDHIKNSLIYIDNRLLEGHNT